jgi:acyl carrier protein
MSHSTFNQASGAGKKPAFGITRAKDLLKLPVHEAEKKDTNIRRRESTYEAPQSAVEKKLVELWTEILNVENIGTADAFIELGGNSLDAARLVSKIHKSFAIRIQLAEIFRLSTIKKLSQRIESSGDDCYSPITPLELKEYYDVSYGQKRIWLIDQLEEKDGAYNVSDAYILENLNWQAFEKALLGLIKRHEILRTTFIKVKGEPKQKIHDYESTPFKINAIDWRDKEVDLQGAELNELLVKEAFAMFDLTRGPLLRATLVHLQDNRYLFIFAMHHIISDGWSIGAAMKDIRFLYNACLEGRENVLPPLSIQYKEFAAWHNGQLSDQRLSAHRHYWKSRFSGEIPVLKLTGDYPRPAIKTQDGGKVWCVLDENITAALRDLSKKNEGSLFMILFAAAAALLYYYTGQQDFVIGTAVTGRDNDELDNQIGLYLNLLPIRVTFSGDQSFESLINKVRESILDGFNHQVYPFDRLNGDLDFERDLSRSPLFDVTVQLLNFNIDDESGSQMSGVSTKRYDVGQVRCKYDIQMNFSEGKDYIYTVFEYNSDLFKQERIARMLERFQKLIDRLLTNPAQRLSNVSIEEERNLSAIRPIARKR